MLIVHGFRQMAMCLDKSMQSLEAYVKLLWPIELGKIRHDELGVFGRLRDGLEIDEFRHLDLLVQATLLVSAQATDITDGERVRSLDGDLPWFATVEALHSLDFRKRDIITVLKAMSRLIQRRHKAFLINSSNDAVNRVLASRIDNSEVLAKVTEDLAEQTKGIRDNEVDALLVAIIANSNLVFPRSICEDDNLEVVKL
jgi:hypothetical protein